MDRGQDVLDALPPMLLFLDGGDIGLGCRPRVYLTQWSRGRKPPSRLNVVGPQQTNVIVVRSTVRRDKVLSLSSTSSTSPTFTFVSISHRPSA